MLAKFEYVMSVMSVMQEMFGIVNMLFHDHNIQATYPTAYSVQNLTIILQAAHIMPDCGRRQAFFSSLISKKTMIGPQMKLPVDSFRLSGLPRHML